MEACKGGEGDLAEIEPPAGPNQTAGWLWEMAPWLTDEEAKREDSKGLFSEVPTYLHGQNQLPWMDKRDVLFWPFHGEADFTTLFTFRYSGFSKTRSSRVV